ncbi:copper radical oxidase [Amylocystis lapponica]|nr:copper radical oxidase [Amylocystis lapponica]
MVSLLAVWTLVVFSLGTVASNSAWNGIVIPGSTTPTTFTPYYAPPGTKSYDSSSPLLHYSGSWTDSFSSSYVNQNLRATFERDASMTFTFTGTGVEWFGNQDRRHGISDVYIDGKMVQQVDNWSASPRKQQRIFWTYELPLGRHTIKIVNTGKKRKGSKGAYMDVDALVVTLGTQRTQAEPSAPLDQDLQASQELPHPPLSNLAMAPGPVSLWKLEQEGSTGVNAMQLSIISETHAIIVDKVEHNPLTISGHPAWATLYNLKTHALRPLAMQSNSFCAGGTFLSNGTLINVGGNPVVEDHTSAADFGDLDGLQAIRIFEPCDSEDVDDCNMYENHDRIRMASPRWYNTVLRISDGSAMIIGGSLKGGWINNATVNNPTVEYWPPKNIHGSNGLPIHLPFLVDTLNSNLFPLAFSLPDERIFIAANNDAMIYDWQSNTELRLPPIPNGVRVTYPMAGTGLLLPLSASNDYAAEILLCGGSTVDDHSAGYEISSQAPTSTQCSRLLLTDEGIASGWQVEQMPQARTMPDAVLIVNGAGTGISGYGNVIDQVGASNADHPTLTPVLYNPLASPGQRFSSGGLPASNIPRLYHSVATLTPSGSVMIAGSNPNLDRSEVEYGTEYRVEWLNPPYMMAAARPAVLGFTSKMLRYGQALQLKVQLPVSSSDSSNVQVVLMDLGYVTHAVHANSRMVYLATSLSQDKGTLTITGPPNAGVYPPGPGFLYIVANGIPSTGTKIMVGDGKGPAVDEDALTSLLTNTRVDQYELSKGKGHKTDSSE